MVSLARRFQVVAFAFVAFIGLVLAAPNFVGPASAATVNVNLFCTSEGFAFNGTYTGNRNSTYNAAYMHHTRRSLPGGGFSGGGDFDWQSMGKVNTGSRGIGSSNTIYMKAAKGTEIDVDLRIGGVVRSVSKTC